MDIFAKALKAHVRFTSNRGELTVEQLWELPLQAKNGFDLDSVAKAANAELKAMAEESFVATKVNPAKAQAELKLEVVKAVIADRMAEAEAQRKRLANQEERQKLLSILSNKQEAALQQLTEEEIKQRIAALEAS